MTNRHELPAPITPDPNWPNIRLPDRPAKPSTPIEALMMAPPGHEPEESTQEIRERAAQVAACVDMLPEQSRRLVEMHVYEGRSYREIELAFGTDAKTGQPRMSKSSAQRYVQRALDELRELLLASGYVPPT